MDKNEMYEWRKNRHIHYTTIIELNALMINTLECIISDFPQTNLLVIKDGLENVSQGSFTEADLLIGDDTFTIRVSRKKDEQQAVYQVIGYDNPPIDSYPEFTVYEGTSCQQLIDSLKSFFEA